MMYKECSNFPIWSQPSQREDGFPSAQMHKYEKTRNSAAPTATLSSSKRCRDSGDWDLGARYDQDTFIDVFLVALVQQGEYAWVIH